MEEGAKLSKRQLELEGSTKKLRQQLKASEAEREKLGALLAAGSNHCGGAVTVACTRRNTDLVG